MSSRRQNEWKRKKSGAWALSLGYRGMRVRLFENGPNGTFYRSVWIPGRGRDVVSLHTRDRDEAERLGRELLAELIRGTTPRKEHPPTLGEVWERYQRESPAFLGSTESTRRDARTRADMLLGYFGEGCDVSSLTENDIRAYERMRIAGGIRRPSGLSTLAVRPRSADADLVLLRTMLKWANNVRRASGERWLKDNPLTGIRRPREPNPKRPVATWERFQKTRQAMVELASVAATDAERQRWVRIEVALVLAEGTGRRLGSIRQLRWEDFDFEKGTIRWRAEADKKRRESMVPYPATFLGECRDFQKRLGALGGWLFPRESDGAEPMDRHLFDKWLTVAERHAKLPKLDGGLWHPYRRKWATERKKYSLKDVAEAGGWKDHETLLTCYQHPDAETLLAVTSEQQKLSELAALR